MPNYSEDQRLRDLEKNRDEHYRREEKAIAETAALEAKHAARTVHRNRIAEIGRQALKIADRAFDGMLDVPSQSDRAVLRSLQAKVADLALLVAEASEAREDDHAE